MSPLELTKQLKAKALELGFTKAGITSAMPFDEATNRLSAWIRAGSQGTMQYMSRNEDKRRDVRNILPGAKSILSLALNYHHEGLKQEQNKLSQYAWGTDYHEIVPPMLRELLNYAKELNPEIEGRYYVDTGPLMEKAIAERAGIGWIGKHTNIITREVGSWVFLSEIILTCELVPDLPAEDFCGSCTKCIEACPTQAIVAPYQLDATRCISYLTIELKSDQNIPVEFDLANWLYGCDTCQDVCPWNTFEQPSTIPEFAPRAENISLAKEEIITMQQEEFSRRFKKSPVKRTKLTGLKRNAEAQALRL